MYITYSINAIKNSPHIQCSHISWHWHYTAVFFECACRCTGIVHYDHSKEIKHAKKSLCTMTSQDRQKQLNASQYIYKYNSHSDVT